MSVHPAAISAAIEHLDFEPACDICEDAPAMYIVDYHGCAEIAFCAECWDRELKAVIEKFSKPIRTRCAVCLVSMPNVAAYLKVVGLL
jgi:hypothetical protein